MKSFEIKNINCHAALTMTENTQSGRSMIEMLGVLAIIGVLSVGGIAGYSKAMHKYRINKTIEQITLIAGNVRTFFAPQGNYDGVHCECNNSPCGGQSSGDGCPVIKKAKILPDEMVVTDNAGLITEISNAFGGNTNLDTYGTRGFYIDYQIAYSEEVCIELISQDWSNTGASSVGLDYPRDIYDFNTTTVSLEDAVSLCSTALQGCKSYNFTSLCPSLRLLFDK